MVEISVVVWSAAFGPGSRIGSRWHRWINPIRFASWPVFHQPLAESCSRSAIAKLLKMPLPTMEIKRAEYESQCENEMADCFSTASTTQTPRTWRPSKSWKRSWIPSGLERRWLLWTNQYFGWEEEGSKEHRTNRSGFGRTSNATQCGGYCGTGAVLCQCDAGRLGRTQDRRSGINHPIAAPPTPPTSNPSCSPTGTNIPSDLISHPTSEPWMVHTHCHAKHEGPVVAELLQKIDSWPPKWTLVAVDWRELFGY